MTGCDLTAARHTLGLSVTELAERLKLDMPNGRTFVRDMESGRKPISGPVEAAVELMLAARRQDDGEAVSVCAHCGALSPCPCFEEHPYGAG